MHRPKVIRTGGEYVPVVGRPLGGVIDSVLPIFLDAVVQRGGVLIEHHKPHVALTGGIALNGALVSETRAGSRHQESFLVTSDLRGLLAEAEEQTITGDEVLAGLRAKTLNDGSFKAEVRMMFGEPTSKGLRAEVADWQRRLGPLACSAGMDRRRYEDVSVTVARGVLPVSVDASALAVEVDEFLRAGDELPVLEQPTVVPELRDAGWAVVSR